MHKTNGNTSYSHIIKYTGLFGGVQLLTILLGIVRNKLVAMLLGPSGMGLVSLFNSTTKMLSDATGLGIQTSGVRNISDAYQNGDKQQLAHTVMLIRSWSFITAIVGMTLCVVLSPCLDSWTFSWGKHTLHFVLLSPIVALTTITGGEMAILKGTRQLKAMASVSVMHVLLALVISVPLYFYLGETGIVPSLVLMAATLMVLTIAYSWRLFPMRLSFAKSFVTEGMGMVRLGIGFVAAAFVISFAEFVVRAFLNNNGSLEILGLYNAGYMLISVYGGMLFAAMETDYFPSLSALIHDNRSFNVLVNKQMEVSLLFVSPLIILLIVFLPFIVPLLFSGNFMEMVPMAQIMACSLYLRAAKLPIAYIPLAKGNSLLFLLMESLFAAGYIAFSIVGYRQWGLLGAGIAFSVAAVVDFIIQSVCMNRKYGFVFSSRVIKTMAIQLPLGFVAYVLTISISKWWVLYPLGILLAAVSAYCSLQSLKKKTRLMAKIKEKFSR